MRNQCYRGLVGRPTMNVKKYETKKIHRALSAIRDDVALSYEAETERMRGGRGKYRDLEGNRD